LILSGVLILDLEARDLPGVVYRVVEELHINGDIEEEQKSEVRQLKKACSLITTLPPSP